MARINLLPWREELRRERYRQFMMTLLLTAVLGVILVFMVGTFYGQKIKHQQRRNELISTEISKMETRIERIQELEQTRSRLISRKQIIEQLQASRSLTVELLDMLAKSIPAGVTLTTIKQMGMNLSVTGSSQSNARVSAYLQSLENTRLFLDPELVFVRATDKPENITEPYLFSIKVKLQASSGMDIAIAGGFDDQEGQGGVK